MIRHGANKPFSPLKENSTSCIINPAIQRRITVKIAFRHLFLPEEKQAHLDALARSTGLEPLWYADDETPQACELQDCEALIGNFPPELLSQLPSLKWMQTAYAGVDKLCAAHWANEEAILTNCSGAFGIAIAEYMLTGLMMLFRLMPAYAANQQQKLWQRVGQCRSIYGSTITVVGMGDIGSRFAHIAKAMGATIRGVRRTPGDIPADFDEVYTSDQLAEAVADVDAVIMALPGTPATHHMVNEAILACMDKRTVIVNCGRGATLDEAALTAALREKRIAGAVLDVMEMEPLPAESPLWHMENVIITPHISGRNEDTVNGESIYRIIAENLERYVKGQPLTHVVDRNIGY